MRGRELDRLPPIGTADDGDELRGAAAVSGRRAGHAQPIGNADQPALQRGGQSRRDLALLAAGQTGGSVTWLLRRLRSRALQEPPIERPEYQDNADVYDQPLPEVVPEKQDVHADHDGY
jgi:hypothetical protein